MKLHHIFTVLSLSLAISTPSFAADKHGHDHKPLHGGIVAEASDVNYELVAKPDLLTIYVVDHDKPVATAGAKATGTVYAGSEKTPVTFEPAGENKLTAKGSFKTGVGVRVAATVTLAGKQEAKVNFRLK